MKAEPGAGGVPSPSAERPDLGDLLLRLISFAAGGALAYAMFLSSARTAPDEAAFLWTSVVGSGGALALYWWHQRVRRDRSLRWYATLGLAAGGAVFAHLILGIASALGNAGALVFAGGAAVGIGVPHGLMLGTAAALMLYGLRGSARRRPTVDSDRRLELAVVAAGAEADEPPPPDAPPASRRPWSRILSGVAGAGMLLAPTAFFLTVEISVALAIWTLSFAVCAAISALWIWMARSGRPMRSRHVLGQVVTVVLFSCAAGWSLFLLVLSPLWGIAAGLFYVAASALLLRAAGGPGGEEAKEADGEAETAGAAEAEEGESR